MKEEAVPLALVVFGILLCIGLVVALLYYVMKITEGLDQRDYILKIVMTAFLILVGVFAADKIIALKRSLLTDNESEVVFQTIRDILLIIVSFYFGTQVSNKNSDKP